MTNAIYYRSPPAILSVVFHGFFAACSMATITKASFTADRDLKESALEPAVQELTFNDHALDAKAKKLTQLLR